MKKLIAVIISFMMINLTSFSQVAINTDSSSPDASSMLDIKSSDKGLLIPRMTTAERILITSPAEGLIVYDTDLGSLCFYRSGSWNHALCNSTGWSVKGNAGTNPGTDFLGTTDNMAVAFRYNNIASGLINSTSTFFGYAAGKDNTGNYSTLIGSYAGWMITSGTANTALGYQSLYKTTTGFSNTAIGLYSLYNNTTGASNVASGASALFYNTTGGSNTANGPSALNDNTTGSWNTAVGNGALYTNTTGFYNTALGSNSGVSEVNLSNTVALGYAAQASANNQVRLGNLNITSLFCQGAFATTTPSNPNLTVDANGQIMRSTAILISGSGTANQVTFWNSPGALTGSNNLYWDNTNARLGIGTSAPNQQLEIAGSFRLPTTISPTTGVIYKGALPFIHNYKSAGNTGANTFIGENSGNFSMASSNVWEASYNTAIGYYALTNNTTGNNNTVIGTSVLRHNTSGYNNTAIGSDALYYNTLGNNNTAIGGVVLYNNTLGYFNTGCGKEALFANTTGNYNTAVGPQALTENKRGSDNTAIGRYALQNDTVANGNTAVGAYSLENYVNGNNNTAVGYFADVSASNLTNTVSLGYNTISNASNQVRLGNSSISTFFCQGAYATSTSSSNPNMTVNSSGQIMRSDVTIPSGTGNTNQVAFWIDSGILTGENDLYWDNSNNRLGIGTQTPNQQLELTGSFRIPVASTSSIGVIFKGADRFIHDYKPAGVTGLNTFLGINAGNFTMAGSGTQASYNTGIGYQSLTALTTGSHNTAMGHFSINDNLSGNYNSGFGEQCLALNTSGNHNVAIGYCTIFNSLTGSYNTVVGNEAGKGVAGNSFTNNSLFGYHTGYALTTGSNNILLGYQAGDAITSGSNNIVIGINIDAPSSTANNQLVIGSQNLLYGDLANYRIGIGTFAPTQKLEIKDGNLLLSNTNTPSEIRFAEPSESGTNFTSFKAQDQTADVIYLLPPDDGNPGNVLSSNGGGVLSWITPNAGDISAVGSMSSGSVFSDATADNDWLGLGSGAGRIEFDNQTIDEVNILNAKVGIGTTTPSQQLEITKNFRLPVTTDTSGIIYSGANPFLHNLGDYNVFLGKLSGNLSLSGAFDNTGIGDSTLYSITSGHYNVAIGTSALQSVSSSTGNTVVGVRAGNSITVSTGGYNTIVGFQAGIENTGDRNTMIGCESGMKNTTGKYNVFLGHQSGYHNTTSNFSTAIGFRALYSQTGYASEDTLMNTAVGYESLYTTNPTNSLDGRRNTAVGYQSLKLNSTGMRNTAVGSGALYSNVSGSDNTAFGDNALNKCTDDNNTAIGQDALMWSTTGGNNTAIGENAIYTLTTGNNNTAVGYNTSCSSNDMTNTTIIGASVFASGSNQVRLGNNAITSFYCQGAYEGVVAGTNLPLYVDYNGKIGHLASSARYKENILDMDDIGWLYKLRPVNFIYKSDETKKKQYGLIAEEVEKVNSDFVSYNEDGSVETVSYSQLIAPMLKAIQDQQALIEELQKRIETLEADK